jgi:hypothetical protein
MHTACSTTSNCGISVNQTCLRTVSSQRTGLTYPLIIAYWHSISSPVIDRKAISYAEPWFPWREAGFTAEEQDECIGSSVSEAEFEKASEFMEAECLLRQECVPDFPMGAGRRPIVLRRSANARNRRSKSCHPLWARGLHASTIDRNIHQSDEAAIRSAIEFRIPALNGEVSRAATCMYTMTRDKHFVIDLHPRYPQVSIAAGFSGHGFKFSSVVGEILCELALSQQTSSDIALFSVSRQGLQ